MINKDNVIEYAKKLAEKFVNKCETGRARSKETLSECKILLEMIKALEDE